MRARRSLILAGIAVGIAVAAATPPVTGGLKDETPVPEKATTQNESAKPPPPCPRVIGAEPVKALPCLLRAEHGLPPPQYLESPTPPSPQAGP